MSDNQTVSRRRFLKTASGIVAAGVVGGAIGFAAGGSLSAPAPTVQTATKTTVSTQQTTTTISSLAALQSPVSFALGSFVASAYTGPISQAIQDQKIYQKYGLNPDLSTFTDNAIGNQAFQQGKTMASMGVSTQAIIAARAQGLNKICAFPQLVASTAILVRADAPYQTIADLTGKTIGSLTSPSSTVPAAIAASNKLRGTQLSYKDFKIVNVPPPVAITQLARGQLDAAEVIEPFVTQALFSQPERVLVTATQAWEDYSGFPFIGSGIGLDGDWAKQNPDAAMRVVQAWIDGAKYVVANPGYWENWVKTNAKITDSKILAALRSKVIDGVTRTLVIPYDQKFIDNLDLWSKTLVDLGFISSLPKGTFDNSYVPPWYR